MALVDLEVLRVPGVGSDSLIPGTFSGGPRRRHHTAQQRCRRGRPIGPGAACRQSHGADTRIRQAGFSARKTLEDSDFAHAPGINRELILHLGTSDFVTARSNAIFLGPPGQGKHTSRSGSGSCR